MSFEQRFPPSSYPWSNLVALVTKKLGDAGVRYRIMGKHGLFLVRPVNAPSGDVHIDVVGRLSEIRDLFKGYVFEGRTMKHVLFPGVAVKFHELEHGQEGRRLVYADGPVYVGTFSQLEAEARFNPKFLDEILEAEAE